MKVERYFISQMESNCVSKDYFEDVASTWDDMQASFFSDRIREKAFEVSNVQTGQIAADIGCGTGYITTGLLDRGLKVIAVDQSESMLVNLAKKFEYLKKSNNQISCIVGNAENLPIDESSVNYAFANMYLHHVENPLIAIKEMYRIIVPGGKLVITDLDHHDFNFLESEHFDRWKGFNRDDIKKWFQLAGLKNVQVLSTEEKCSSQSSDGEKASITVFLAIGEKP